MANTQTKDVEKAQEVVRVEGDRPQRKQRIPFGVPRTKLSVSAGIPGYHLHWINDVSGRIYGAQEGGYEYVAPKEVGAEGNETQVKRLVGTNEDGSPMFAYLMKIRQEWYEEDKAESQKVNDEIERAIKGGKLNEQSGDNRYVPREGISIKSK